MPEVQLAAQVSEAPCGGGSSRGLTAAQKRGLRYQTRVEEELNRLFPGLVEPRPWFRYKVDWETKRCQPDIILRAPDSSWITIIEVKYSTIVEAWQQLCLYKSVVEKAFRVPAIPVLVTRTFDPHVRFPIDILHLEGFKSLEHWRGPDLGVISWKPRGR